MAKKSSRRLTDEERAEWRRQDRERLTQATRELLSSDGWTRWVRTRAMFHKFGWQLHAPGCPMPAINKALVRARRHLRLVHDAS